VSAPLYLSDEQIAQRAARLCEVLTMIDLENDEFARVRKEHKETVEAYEGIASRLRREIETKQPAEEQLSIEDVPPPAEQPTEAVADEIPWNEEIEEIEDEPEPEPVEAPAPALLEPQDEAEVETYERGFTDYLEGNDHRNEYEAGSRLRKLYIAGQAQAAEAEADNSDDDA